MSPGIFDLHSSAAVAQAPSVSYKKIPSEILEEYDRRKTPFIFVGAHDPSRHLEVAHWLAGGHRPPHVAFMASVT